MVRIKKFPSRNVSIKDVARASGVSITTVSRVINKLPSVKEENRSRVLKAVRELDFQPSALAQRLATGRSNVVMLIIPRYEGVFYSFYALELIRGIGTLCEVLKLDLLLHLTDSRSEFDLKGAGGIIFADIIGNQHQLKAAEENGIPCVVINNYIKSPNASCIAIDNKKGAREAVDYLIGLGHKRIAHITGDLVTQAAQQRFDGYRQALEEGGIEFDERYVFKTDYSRGQARQAAQDLLKMNNPASAVFVASDSMALEVMAVARELDKHIPEDLSIVGFDDNPSGLYGPVALTTVRQPLLKMAEEGLKELNRLMNSKGQMQNSVRGSGAPLKASNGTKRILLPAELVIRESCKSFKSA